MFKTALNKNIIPHTWKLANIVPIPKPNKDTDKGTSYRPISLLSVIAKTLEKSLIPYITANIPNTPMQHGYKTQHSTVTALHTLNNTVARVMGVGRQQQQGMITGTTFVDLSAAYDTVNHILVGTRSFIYADDLCTTAQYPTFQEVEQKIEEALGELTHYYRSNSLRANPDKTQVTAFHLRNREAKRSLQVS